LISQQLRTLIHQADKALRLDAFFSAHLKGAQSQSSTTYRR